VDRLTADATRDLGKEARDRNVEVFSPELNRRTAEAKPRRVDDQRLLCLRKAAGWTGCLGATRAKMGWSPACPGRVSEAGTWDWMYLEVCCQASLQDKVSQVILRGMRLSYLTIFRFLATKRWMEPAEGAMMAYLTRDQTGGLKSKINGGPIVVVSRGRDPGKIEAWQYKHAGLCNSPLM
jgi:hypothetical protein